MERCFYVKVIFHVSLCCRAAESSCTSPAVWERSTKKVKNLSALESKYHPLCTSPHLDLLPFLCFLCSYKTYKSFSTSSWLFFVFSLNIPWKNYLHRDSYILQTNSFCKNKYKHYVTAVKYFFITFLIYWSV